MMLEDEYMADRDDVSVIGGRDIPIFDHSPYSKLNKQTQERKGRKYFWFEVVTACIIGLGTLSGGILEGYTSPALPTLLRRDIEFTRNNISELTQLTKTSSYFSNINKTSNLQKRNAVKAVLNKDNQNSDDFLTTTIINDFTNTATEEVRTTTSNTFQDTQSDKTSTILNFKNNLKNKSLISTSTAEPTKKTIIDYTNNILITKQEETTTVTSTQIYPIINGSEEIVDNGSNKSEDLQLSSDEASWFGSLLLLGACFGSTLSSWMVSKGRKRAILESAIPRIIGWILIASATNIHMMYIGRILAGISLGIVTSAAPLYISEIAHPTTRGALGCVVQLGVNIGIFIAAVVGTFLTWRGLAIFGALSVVLYFFATWYVPRSPSWLVMSGDQEGAITSLNKLRDPLYNIEPELQQIVAVNSNRPQSISWFGLMREKRCTTPLCIVLLITAVNRFSGYNAIITYCAIFLHSTVPYFSEYWAAVAVTAIQVVTTIFAASVVDKVGRRYLLLLSVLLMAGSLVVIVICDVISPTSPGTNLVALGCMMIYLGSYSMGIGPLTWVLIGELFPHDAREKGSAIVATFNWFAAFIITKTYFRMEITFGVTGTCIFYAAVCIVGAILIYFFVPETKGKTLPEIEAYFSIPMQTLLSEGANRKSSVQMLSTILQQDSNDSYSTFHPYQSLE